MEAEPPKADPPKRKRRWFQFSLRSLMIGVMLLAVPCSFDGWQERIVAMRHAEMDRICAKAGYLVQEDIDVSAIPWIRRRLGDRAYYEIMIQDSSDVNEISRLRALFPEAIVRTDPYFRP